MLTVKYILLIQSSYKKIFLEKSQMKTGKWFIKPVLQLTIFVRFGGILTAIQPESSIFYCGHIKQD